MDNENQTFCVYDNRKSVLSCSEIGATFLDCSLISPSECFACEKVADSVKF